MFTREQYEANERRLHANALALVAQQSLAERKEAKREWLDAMKTSPELVAERVGWLLQGCYGWGSMDAARKIARNKRMNRVAALAQLIASYEWQCPSREAASAWNSLSAVEQIHVNDAILATMTDWLADPENEVQS